MYLYRHAWRDMPTPLEIFVQRHASIARVQKYVSVPQDHARLTRSLLRTSKLCNRVYRTTGSLAREVESIGTVVSIYPGDESRQNLARGVCVKTGKKYNFCFRGANGPLDVAEVLLESEPSQLTTCTLSSRRPGAASSEPMRVHRGFLKHLDTVRDQVLLDIEQCLDENADECQLEFSGHSMGGSIAMLAFAVAREQFPNSESLRTAVCHTFGTPCTGNRAFLESIKQRTVMVRHPYDLVPCARLHDDLWQLEGLTLDVWPSSSDCPTVASVDFRKFSPKRLLYYHSTDCYYKTIEQTTCHQRDNANED